MSLHLLSESDLRTGCKEAIEALELWLRRVIDMALRPDFGDDYVIATRNGQYLFRRQLRCSIMKRRGQSPKVYPRPIDAALLEDEIYIVCLPGLYKDYFRPFFKASYPHCSRDHLRFMLAKLVDARNRLMHSNPISVRQAEQVICYSYDIIEAIRAHAEELNMGQDYNAPRIVRLSDSNGSVFHDAQIRRNATGRGHVQTSEFTSTRLRAGDRLSIETEIDPSFPPCDYRIQWMYENPAPEHARYLGKRITIELLECHVREDFTVYCKVISNQSWHRCGDVDDCVGLTYKVLPPLLAEGREGPLSDGAS